MAGALKISTLNDDIGVLATQNGMTGIAKAWVNFNGKGTVAILDSYNVSSITDNGTGDYTVNFTTAMPNANYSTVMTAGGGATGQIMGLSAAGTLYPTQLVGSVRLVILEGSSPFAARDAATVGVAVFSS